jgi:two-component system, sensor histidine kinase and response regulator
LFCRVCFGVVLILKNVNLNLRSFLLVIALLAGLNSFTKASYEYSSSAVEANLKIDSLKNLLSSVLASKGKLSDTSSINNVNKLADEYFNINVDSTMYYGNLAIESSLAIKYDKGVADGLLHVTNVYVRKGDYINAAKNLERSQKLYINLKDDKGLSDCFLLYGWMNQLLANYDLASSYYKQALEIKTRIKDEAGKAECYNKMGIIAGDTGKPSSALDDYFKALTINIKLHNDGDAARNYNNIGTVMQDMEIYPKSMEYFQRAIKIWQKTNDIHSLSVAYENIGEILMAQKKFEEAVPYLTKALKLNEQLDDKEGISLLNIDFGLYYANKKQYKEAIDFLNKALDVATKYKIDLNKASAYLGLATAYNMQGNYKEAYKNAVLGKSLSDKLGNLPLRMNAALQLSNALGGLKQFEAYKVRTLYDELKDSLKNDVIIQKLTSFNLESNFADKQRQLAEQHQRVYERYKQNILQQELLSVLFAIIIIGMGAILIVYYKGKQKQQKVNAKLEETNQQVLQQKTDLDEQAQKLKDSNVLKNRLISVLAHDLRAPLSTLRGLFGLLDDDGISQEQFLAIIPKVLRKLEYTSDFLDTLLFWINSQMENFNNSAKSFSVKDLAKLITDNYHEQAADKGITIVENVPDSLIALADPNSVRIVIRNLVTNAIKFSEQNDTITINGHLHKDKFVLLSIKDTGIGMSAVQLNKLFKSKVDSEMGTNNESGTGLGLLFCKELIEKCNGEIWVQSQPGEGTEFFLTLPLSPFKAEETALH